MWSVDGLVASDEIVREGGKHKTKKEQKQQKISSILWVVGCTVYFYIYLLAEQLPTLYKISL